MKQSLAEHIYQHLSKYILIAVIVISFILGYITFSWYIARIFAPVNRAMLNMQILSTTIEANIRYAQSNIEYFLAKDSQNIKNRPLLHNVFQGLGASSTYFYGIGFALSKESYGEYIYESNAKTIVTENLNAAYARYHTTYNQRAWYKLVLQSKQVNVFSPQRSMLGESINLLTYAFPIFQNHEVIAVAIIDIAMRGFERYLDELWGEVNTLSSDLRLYYVSKPYPGMHNNDKFYLFTNPEKVINYQSTINALHQIYVQRSNYPGWRYYDGKLYQTLSYLDDGLCFILVYDLSRIFLFAILWLGVTFGLARLFLNFTRKIIKHELFIITQPITEISNLAQIMAVNRLNLPFNLNKNDSITEISLLRGSLEQMRNETQQLLCKEKELEKTHAELGLSARMQKKFIPETFMEVVKLDQLQLTICAKFVTARTLSGDLYDVVIKPADIYVLIGDSTGKDVTAAFFSLFVLGKFRFLSEQLLEPDQILFELNNYLCEMDAENMFISAVCLRIKLVTAEISFANAGHEMPILYDQWNQVQNIELYEPDLVLGVLPDHAYQLYRLKQLSELKHLCLYTDGITEVKNAAGQFFGAELVAAELSEILQKNTSSAQICDMLLNSCNIFAQTVQPSDDQTIISIGIRQLN